MERSTQTPALPGVISSAAPRGPLRMSSLDLETVTPSEVTPPEKGKHGMTSLKCGIEKETTQMNLSTKQT